MIDTGYAPRILMFAPFCYPPAGAEAIVTAKLVRAMINAGWDIDVIGQADEGHFYPHRKCELWEPVCKVVRNIEGGIIAKGMPRRQWGKAIRRAQSLLWAMEAVRTAEKLMAKKRYGFILSRVAPQYGHLPALMLSRKTSMPWIANWSDPMPPQKAPRPYGCGPAARISYLGRKYYAEIGKKASWHTFPSERLRKYVCSYMPEIVEKSSAIPHIALSGCLSHDSGESKDFTLCHIGGLGLRNPKTFLEGVKLFLRERQISSSFALKFVGLDSDSVRKLAVEIGIEDVIFLEGAKTYEETLRIAGESSVLVLIEAPCDEGLFLPSKFVDFVQTGRPILAVSPETGTLSDILMTHGGGIVADCRSPQAVAGAIHTLHSEWKVGKLVERFGSGHLFALFSEATVLEKYMEIFRKAAADRRVLS